MITIWFSDDKQSVMLMTSDQERPRLFTAVEALELADRLIASLRPDAPQQDKREKRVHLTQEMRHPFSKYHQKLTAAK